jgi:hypothetical protein
MSQLPLSWLAGLACEGGVVGWGHGEIWADRSLTDISPHPTYSKELVGTFELRRTLFSFMSHRSFFQARSYSGKKEFIHN